MQRFKGKRVLITAGPTHEPIDPVRFISNNSSGKQGYAIAEAMRDEGAEVILVSGPVCLKNPEGVTVIKVKTARQMLLKCRQQLPADLFIAAAAVSDWRPKNQQNNKIKKTGSLAPVIELIENPDILKTIATSKKNRPKLVIGFAAETSELIENAEKKILSKGADWIIANDVSGGKIFDSDETEVVLITSNLQEKWSGKKHKIAKQLVDRIIATWK